MKRIVVRVLAVFLMMLMVCSKVTANNDPGKIANTDSESIYGASFLVIDGNTIQSNEPEYEIDIYREELPPVDDIPTRVTFDMAIRAKDGQDICGMPGCNDIAVFITVFKNDFPDDHIETVLEGNSFNEMQNKCLTIIKLSNVIDGEVEKILYLGSARPEQNISVTIVNDQYVVEFSNLSFDNMFSNLSFDSMAGDHSITASARIITD